MHGAQWRAVLERQHLAQEAPLAAEGAAYYGNPKASPHRKGYQDPLENYQKVAGGREMRSFAGAWEGVVAAGEGDQARKENLEGGSLGQDKEFLLEPPYHHRCFYSYPCKRNHEIEICCSNTKYLEAI